MTKGQRWSLRRKICIGSCLLLLCNVVAAANNKISTATSEPTAERFSSSNATLLRKVPEDNGSLSNARNESLASYVLDERTRDEVNTDQGTNSNREKVAPTESALDVEKQPTSRSADEVNKPVALSAPNTQADRTNRKSRLTNNVDQNLGKSSSTKTGSEISPRPTRINDLTTASNKRGPEPLPDEAFHNKSENSSFQSFDNEGVHQEQCEHGKTDCEATTVRNIVPSSLNDFIETKKKRLEDFDVKESDEPDAEDGDEEKLKDENISLVNDTYVNYNHYYKTQHTNSGTTVSSNGTESNTIPKGVDVPDKSDPKRQVEIVGDVTNVNRLRIRLKDNDTESQDSVSTKNGTRVQETRTDSKGKYEKVEEGTLNNESSASEVSDSSSASKSSSSESNESKDVEKLVSSSDGESSSSSVENVTESIESLKNYNGGSITANESTSLQPKGRTVSFSKINDFSNVDRKMTTSTKESDVVNEKISHSAPLNKNMRSELTIEQRPYPYVKSNKNSTNDTSVKSQGESEEKKSAEEVASYENTIRQSQSEKKFVITEPSVVIENSIQQVKPNFLRKSGNATTVDASNQFESHVTSTALPATTARNLVARNETILAKAEASSDVGQKSVKHKTSDTENVVSLDTKEKPKVINTGNFDVTGNAITEVSQKSAADSADKLEPSYGISPSPLGIPNGTEVPAVFGTTLNPETVSKLISSKTDVQTDVEESMLTRSNFNVSEGSTEYPLTKHDNGNKTTAGSFTFASVIDDTTDASLFTVNDEPASDTFQTTTHNSEDSVPESLVNSTDPERSAGSTLATSNTVEPDVTSLPTTIQIEFVGLTEETVSQNESTSIQWNSVTGSAEKNVSTTLETALQPTTEDFTTGSDTTTETNEVTLTTVYVTEAIINTTEDIATSNADGTTSITDEVQPTTVEFYSTELPDTTTASTNTVGDQTTSVDLTTIEAETRKTTESDVGTTNAVTQSETVMTSTERSVPMTKIDTTNVTESATVSGSATITKATVLLSTTDTITSTTFVPSTVISPRITSSTPSVSSTTRNVLTERIPEEPTDITPTLSADEITSLVKIVIEGSWQDVCSRLIELRQSLADILSTGTDKEVSPKQIIFHQSACLDSASSTAVPSDDPFTSMLIYVVDEKGNFDEGLTKVLPSLYYKVSPINFPVTIHSFLLVQEADSRNAIAAVVISSVAFICLLLLAGLLFIMRKRQTRFNYGERCRPVSLDAYSLDSVPACNSIRRKGAVRSSKRSYGNPTFEDSSVIPSHPLNFAGLSSFCSDVNAISEEFSSIPQVSGKIDELPPGAEVKNRYANVVPLPETRVPLQRLSNDPLTEYINASYVRGPKNATKYYIACQAPMESTVTDFWRMIWEQQCKVIIMLTDLVENGVEKCTEYIPPSEVTDCHRLYGDYQVTLKKRETKEKYAISTLHLKNLENNTFREVFHIWYLWPMNGVQSDGAGLIAVLLEARALQRGGPGPIVVHCSPGTGRTGTLIALDLGIRQYEITRTVDVPRVVYTIRRDRAGAVQTKEQYAFIYKALNLYATKLAGGVLEST